MGTEGQAVRFRGCTCPGTPHDEGDIVWMRSSLGFAAGTRAVRAAGQAVEAATAAGLDIDKDADAFAGYYAEFVSPVFIKDGPLSWNVVDEDGPVPLTPEALDALPFGDAYTIAEWADDHYSMGVFDPLAARMSALSGNGQNGASTPRTRRSSKPRRSPPRSSSANGSAGAPSPVSP